MTPAQALAKLIEKAPELAGEVMPEGWGLLGPIIICDVRRDEDGEPYDYNAPNMHQLPGWFYQAVAGKLAEWLAEKHVWVLPRDETAGRIHRAYDKGTHRKSITGRQCKTRFQALVEATIAVHSSS